MMLHRSLLVLMHLLHIGIILFCLVGWLLPAARPWHLMLCGLIIASWFGVGAWKGWGYCLVTDLHWRLLRRMGSNVPPSAICRCSGSVLPDVWRMQGASIE
jgi:hypothetical protein